MLTYGLRAIAAHPRAYAGLVARGLEVPLRDLVLLGLPAVLVPLFWLRTGKRRGIALATLAFTLLHLAHLALCAAIELVIPRYRWLTLAPLLGAALVAVGLLVLDFGSPRLERARRRYLEQRESR
jgi:hypothetical protein